ncbi:hypothetical protein NLM97_24645, partial [Escherichia coli]|nr:hypothetical protein [Escherichia coli]
CNPAYSKSIHTWLRFGEIMRGSLSALLSNASQVGVPSIAQPSTHLKNISFLNPPMVLLKEFEKFSTPLFHRFSKNRKCGVSLTALRNTLLPKLISGELSLEDLPDLSTDTEAA